MRNSIVAHTRYPASSTMIGEISPDGMRGFTMWFGDA
jgi:hypothetical protein